MGIVSFGRFEVDLEGRIIRKAGITVRLAPQPFTILAALLEATGAVVTREELRRRLWPDGTFLEYEQAINVSIRRLREVLGESGANPTYIETIPRVGYRWIHPLPAAPPSSGAAASSPLPPQVPSLGSNSPGGQAPVSLQSMTPRLHRASRHAEAPMARPWRWKLASLALAASIAAVTAILLFSNKTAALDPARFFFAQSSSAMGKVRVTRDAPDSKCLNFAGRWRTTPDLSEMEITQSGCALTGSFVSTDGAYRHTFAGDSRSDEATIVVERTDIRNCRTEMSVTLYLDNDRDLTYVVTRTAGRCQLGETYRETRLWKPASLPGEKGT